MASKHTARHATGQLLHASCSGHRPSTTLRETAAHGRHHEDLQRACSSGLGLGQGVSEGEDTAEK